MTWKPFIKRITIFLIILYAIIPTIIYKLGTKAQISIDTLFTPIILAGMIITFIILEREQLKNYKYQNETKQTIIYTILSYILFALYILQQKQWWGVENNTIHLLTGYALYTIGTFILILAIFNNHFVKTFLKSILAMLGVTATYAGLSVALNLAGYPIARALSKPLVYLLSLTNEATMTIENAPVINVGKFTGIIGPPCTGITSLILFTGLFLFVLILDWKKINKKQIWWIYSLGAIGMLLVAFLRLYLLMYIGANYSPEFAMQGFHTNAGWLLFIVYFFVYFSIMYPKLLLERFKYNKIVQNKNKRGQK